MATRAQYMHKLEELLQVSLHCHSIVDPCCASGEEQAGETHGFACDDDVDGDGASGGGGCVWCVMVWSGLPMQWVEFMERVVQACVQVGVASGCG